MVLVAWEATDLIESLRIRDEFLTTVSHELRTPMTSITGYLEVLLGDRIEQLLTIATGTHNLLNLREVDVADLTRVASPNTNSQPLEQASTSASMPRQC